MMKNYSLIILLIVVSIISATAQNGWRENEMEVKIDLQNSSDYEVLNSLHLNGDVYPNGKAIYYLI